MDSLFELQMGAMLILSVILLGVEVWAFVEALRGRADLFQAHGKLTKPAWVAITGVAALLGFTSLGRPVSLLGIIGVVAAGVFLADVRPLVRPGKGNSSGPYGPW
ncbi:DUF2516 family protein [Dermacoccus barathri]|uniref:DUF2516 family protein n=1 Tax=Dermacoccus barathri TaxID=322601 RepID=UPI001879050B|nr:DUF2516 family protein [Dermacoccus barathri]MBE7371371.1 DUF2516 family protein [Dermacoccus barathri]